MYGGDIIDNIQYQTYVLKPTLPPSPSKTTNHQILKSKSHNQMNKQSKLKQLI